MHEQMADFRWSTLFVGNIARSPHGDGNKNKPDYLCPSAERSAALKIYR
jgi:hypothetical protein